MSDKLCTVTDVAWITPSNLTGEAVSDTKITLSWLSGINQGYTIYRDAVAVATGVKDTSYMDSLLNPLTEYCYTLTALCENEEESGPSNEICITTQQEVSITEAENNTVLYPNPANTNNYISLKPIIRAT